MSDTAPLIGWRGLVGPAFLAVFFAIAPSRIEPWRLDPTVRNAVTLSVGEPVRWLDLGRRSGLRRQE